jgi:hypothetical protein
MFYKPACKRYNKIYKKLLARESSLAIPRRTRLAGWVVGNSGAFAPQSNFHDIGQNKKSLKTSRTSSSSSRIRNACTTSPFLWQRSHTNWDLIRDSQTGSGEVYGSPRVFGDLRAAGETCGKHRVARITPDPRTALDLGAESTQSGVHGRYAGPRLSYRHHAYPHLVGWRYLTVVMDLYARKMSAGR